ncbi:cobalt-precorrin-6A reductase, partial [Dermatophilus congolensis]|uniref:cobalt-precorrin-6A reductase n=6 Tax=Dermatophilus congolensis TaxID=1863 RepID=UPI001AAEBE6F
MSTPHLLLLGGTTESRLLANELADAFPGWRITNSLAGRTHTTPNLPGDTRTGGFGGPENMATWLRENGISAIIDATHPFANTITTNTITAARTAIPGHEIPYLRLQRPQWEPHPGDNWHTATTPTDAAQHIDTLGTRALITTGRRDLAAFTHVKAHCLIRTIEPPTEPLPTSHELILDRGPYTLEGETTLINNHHIDVLVTKNSGGAATAPKLQAARTAGIPVIMIQRPTLPDDIDIA